MNRTANLYLRINSRSHGAGGTLVDWAVLDFDGNKVDGGFNAVLEQLDDLRPVARSMQTVVIAPGEDILFRKLTVPARQKRYLKQTLPYLMEEVIAEPVEHMHIVSGRESVGQYPVMAASHARMRSWLALLQGQGITPGHMLSDTYAAALSLTEMHVLFDEKYAIISTGATSLKTETSNIALFLRSCVGNSGTGELPVDEVKFVVTESACADVQVNAEIADTTAFLQGRDIAATVEKIDNTFDYLCRHLNAFYKTSRHKELADLIRGPYQTDKVRRLRIDRRLAAAAVLIVIGLKVVSDLATGFYLRHEIAQLESQAIALYRSLFPQDNKIVNIRTQMAHHLKQAVEAQPQTGFLILVGMLGRQLSLTGKLAEMQIQQLRYDSRQNTLWLDVHVKNIELLDQLKRSLENQSLNVTILSVNNEEQWIKGRLSITNA